MILHVFFERAMKNAKSLLKNFWRFYHVPDGIRTHGLPLRRRTLYPAELRKQDHVPTGT